MLIRGLASVLISLLPATGSSAAGAESPLAPYTVFADAHFALIGVSVIDGSGGPVRENQTIVVKDGRIVALGPADQTHAPDSARKLDLAGHTLIPGLIGMHNHTHMPGIRFMPYSAPRLYLAGGVTTMQTTGSASADAEIALAKAVANGEVPGPRIFATAPYLSGPGASSVMSQPENVQAARDFVDHWAENGATWIKLYRHVQPEFAAAAIDQAHRRNLKVTGHLCSLTFAAAARMGIDSIEHGLIAAADFVAERETGECVSNHASIAELEIDSAAVNELIQTLVAEGVTLTATPAIIESHFAHRWQGSEREFAAMSPALVERYHQRQERLAAGATSSRFQPQLLAKFWAFERRFVAAGGRLVAGPDNGRHVLPGYADQRNFELLVEAGFSVPQAVQIMTSNAAQVLGIDQETGQVQAGMRADLVLVVGDLSSNPAAIHAIRWVFKQGVAFDPAELRESARGQVGIR